MPIADVMDQHLPMSLKRKMHAVFVIVTKYSLFIMPPAHMCIITCAEETQGVRWGVWQHDAKETIKHLVQDDLAECSCPDNTQATKMQRF